MACSGKCEVQVTKILNDPIRPDIIVAPGEPQPPLDQWAHKADSEAAAAALIAGIQAWAQNVATTPCPQPAPPPAGPAPFIPCICTPVEQLTDQDWAKRPTLQQEFRHKFNSRNRKWEAKVTIDYKVAFVDGVCKEPAGFIRYVASIGIIEGHGLAVLAADGRELPASLLEKLKGALG